VAGGVAEAGAGPTNAGVLASILVICGAVVVADAAETVEVAAMAFATLQGGKDRVEKERSECFLEK